MQPENIYNDKELLRQVAEGDEDAFTVLYSRYYPRLSFFASRFIADKETARDITAETFIKWWQSRANFDSIGHLEGFLYITTRNACLNALQRSRKQEQVEQELRKELQATAEAGFLQRDLRSELLENVFLEVEKLPRKYHQVVQLAFLQGLKNDEIAEQLGIAHKTVRTYKSEVLQLLRNVFDLKLLLLILPFLKH